MNDLQRDMERDRTPLRAVVGWSWRGRYAGDKIVVWRLDCGHTVELPSNRGTRKRCRCSECYQPASVEVPWTTEFLRDPNVDGCGECGGPANDPDSGIAAHGGLICGDCATQDISLDREAI